jgi:hypothetical protein
MIKNTLIDALPSSLMDSKGNKVENNGKVRSSGHTPWLSTFWRGRGACWSSEMGLGKIDKLQSITWICTKLTQSGFTFGARKSHGQLLIHKT